MKTLIIVTVCVCLLGIAGKASARSTHSNFGAIAIEMDGGYHINLNAPPGFGSLLITNRYHFPNRFYFSAHHAFGFGSNSDNSFFMGLFGIGIGYPFLKYFRPDVFVNLKFNPAAAGIEGALQLVYTPPFANGSAGIGGRFSAGYMGGIPGDDQGFGYISPTIVIWGFIPIEPDKWFGND